MITSQYRNPLNFNEETFPAAKNSLKRIDKVIHRIIHLITQNNHSTPISDDEAVIPYDNDEIKSKIEQYQEEMELFLCDDLNTPRAMASFFQMISIIEKYLKQFNHVTNNIIVEAKHLNTLQYFLKKLERFDGIFGFLFPQKSSSNHSTDCNCSESTAGKTPSSLLLADIPEEVISLAQQRFQLKSEKKYSESDVLRQKILELGYVIKDNKEGYDLILKDL